MSEALCIDYYRQNRRVIDALIESRCIKSSKSIAPRRFAEFLQSNPVLIELRGRLGKINIFSALGVTEREIRHSRVLRWILDPAGSHGMGSTFLVEFLGRTCSAAELKGINPGYFSCRCEEKRVDLVLVNDTDRIVVVIENKIHALQGEEQLRRYRAEIEKSYESYTRKFVFLTLRGDDPADSAWTSVNYQSLLTAFGKILSQRKAGDEAALSLLLRHYAAIIQGERNDPRQANILDILHLARHELKHSDFLAWLFDPTESHGLETKFLEYVLCLLKKKGVPLDTAVSLDAWDFQVRREEEDIDVFLVSEKHRLVIAIENKVFSKEHGDQLHRYGKRLTKYYSGDRLIKVYLDFKGKTASCSDYWSISYTDLLPFFIDTANSAFPQALTKSQDVAVILEHYRKLLDSHLWITRKTITTPPPSIVGLCNQLAKEAPSEVGYLLSTTSQWQKSLGKRLEPFLYTLADRYFGCSLKATWKVWYTFVPKAFDSFRLLREAGADLGAQGRLARYEFFVIPFGDDISVREAGIRLDFKLLAAKPDLEKVKQKLHESALADRDLFNRVTSRVNKFDLLLSYRLCSFQDAVTLPDSELRLCIERRLARFAASFHQEIVQWFTRELGARLNN